ncbi:hypothetical protein A9Z40_08630 [Microbacterium arborescens]|uniref:SAM-dependent methyltransferase n=1 Tax=Microbacterium arborescens TaxID=33883 RepID=A0ABX2WGN0_9MICO|nr:MULTISPECIES: hypothetical protein [Microbacterium]OAZ39858.1 hypothetical protein A9Z40_08630 [Microbacterium arborescens]QCR40157.1 SAM-dependent methyltransferase [Microbacterium sp. SGAir0570]
MVSPYVYAPGTRLSLAELGAARLDGDVVEVGEAFMPADAVESPEIRAASLRPLVAQGLALTHESAAWVHGALSEPPLRHSVQRCTERRRNHVLDPRLRYRDLQLPASETVRLGGMPVSNRVRTLCDLLRADAAAGDGPRAGAVAMIGMFPDILADARVALACGGPLPHKRRALAWLESWTVRTT